MRCCDPENTLIRHGKEYPEFSGMIPQSWCPNSAARLHLRVAWMRQLGECMAYELPVDEVSRMQNRQPWDAIKAGGSQVKIPSHPDDIRVRVIRVKDGVAIGTVPLVTDP